MRGTRTIVAIAVLAVCLSPHTLSAQQPSVRRVVESEELTPDDPQPPKRAMSPEYMQHYQVSDDEEARWKTQLEPAQLDGILGRPSRFALRDGNLIVPSGRSVVERSLIDGLVPAFFGRRFNSVVQQVARGPLQEVICTLSNEAAEDPRSAWRLNSNIGEEPEELVGHGDAPWRIVAGELHHVCTCADDGRMILWDLGPRAKKLATIQGYARNADGSAVRGEFAAFSPFGRWLATVYDDWITFRLAHSGRTTFVWQPRLEQLQHVMAIRFDTNGNNLLAFVQDSKDGGRKTTRFLRFNVDSQHEDRIEGHARSDVGLRAAGR